MEYKLPKLPARPQISHKGTFGKVLNIAGSSYMPGAAYLSSISALKVGAGYVELASYEKVLTSVSHIAPEIILAPINAIPELIQNCTVAAIGCGLSMSKKSEKLFDNCLKNLRKKNIVIDADGLNILSGKEYYFDTNAILTPHPKEAARLLGCSSEDILSEIELSAKRISEKYNCITVLKTNKTIVTDGINIYKNTSGCSALAKAGSGDVLCGMITGLVAQGMNLFDASALGVYLHGLAGELAAKDLSEYGVLASDQLRYIPLAIKHYLADSI